MMENTKKKSFALGYSLVGHSFISYMFQAIVMVALSNAIIPSFIDKFNPEGLAGSPWNLTTMSLANTLAAVFAAAVGIFIGQWVDKKGAKQVLTVGFFVGGVNYMLMPFAPGFAVWCINMAFVHISMFAYVQMTTHSLVAHWFNKKKGLALGIAAVGIPAGNAGFLKLYTMLNEAYGMTIALWAFGVGLIIMGFLSIFWVRNYPHEAGLTPDGLPLQEKEVKSEDRSYRFSEVIRNPKIWGAIITYGFLNCVTIACSAQAVDYVVEKGIANGANIVSLCMLTGIAGGFIISLIDQKIGPRKATICYTAAMIVVYMAMFFIPKGNNVIVIVLCCVAFAFSGAPAPLFPSLIISIFGPESFNSVSKLATPLVMMLRACGYFMATVLYAIFGHTWSGVYVGLAIITAIALLISVINKEQRSEIHVKDMEADIFAQGERFFGFNFRFQGDIQKIKRLIYGENRIGSYVNRTIDKTIIAEIVEAGTWAPEDKNVQPCRFVALSDPDILAELKEKINAGVVPFAAKLRERFPGHPELKKDTEEFLRNLESAPLVVMAFTKNHIEGEELAGEIKQISSAFQSMLLTAYDKGIGSYWLTSPIAAGAAPNLKKQFAQEGDGEFVGLVTFGYFDKEVAKPLVKMGSVEYI